MAGIYIHVPFCKVKCGYCDFYSMVKSDGIDNFSNLIEKEIKLRKDFLPQGQIETVYFGGGTPSLLSTSQIDQIINSIEKTFTISKLAEITLEANPDDLNLEYLKQLRLLGINRLSIGIQSFCNNDLVELGRRHNAQQATAAVTMAHGAGIENISIDLIYGLPSSTSAIWESNLKKGFDLPIRHLSCYHLTYEETTPLGKKLAEGKVVPINEEVSAEQFRLLQQKAKENNFIHYEISNLAVEGFFSKHNISYWREVPYLGLGPSAHSYNVTSREWNPKSIEKWALGIEKEVLAIEQEILSENDRLNDYLLTSLRTIWGADLDYISKAFGKEKALSIRKLAQKYIQLGIIECSENILKIRPNHFLISDGVIADFLLV